MLLNMAIMDDEQMFCDDLADKLRRWGKDTNNLVNISCYNRSDTFIDVWETQKNFDVVFLDIKMENCSLSGIDVAHKIREHKDNALIVFVTSISDYVFEGYRLEAVRYLVKPIQEYDFSECMSRLSVQLENKGSEIFLMKCRGSLVRIPYKDILYFSSANNYIEIHTESEVIRHLKKLKYIEDTLPSQFVKCHRSIIINIENVAAITGNVVTLINQEKLPISKQYKVLIQNKFLQYYG